MVKTYKRETAWALLAGLAALCVYGLWKGDQTALEWAKLFTVPAITFALAAFGLDAAVKQWPHSGKKAPQDYNR
ncbi:hypothetical protein LP7551_02053 [Roseibium album]|nr:hypothetical protein LP7551_02053 [Roseibium album]